MSTTSLRIPDALIKNLMARNVVFGGEGALTADKGKLAEAQQADMEAPEKTWGRTGWYQARDGKWRFEIDDSDARIVAKGFTVGETKRLGDVLSHPSLYAAYPELAETKFRIAPMGYGTSAVTNDNGITYNAFLVKPDRMLRTLLHEAQHVIQEREGFMSGGNTAAEMSAPLRVALEAMQEQHAISRRVAALSSDRFHELVKPFSVDDITGPNKDRLFDDAYERAVRDTFDKNPKLKERHAELQKVIDANQEPLSEDEGFQNYRRLLGETEARNAAGHRLDMTSGERASAHPESTQDVAPLETIVRYKRAAEVNDRISQFWDAQVIEAQGAATNGGP